MKSKGVVVLACETQYCPVLQSFKVSLNISNGYGDTGHKLNTNIDKGR